MKKILIGFFLLILLISFKGQLFAYENPSKDILGVSADNSFPQTPEGAGFILPDSPFYFLDHLKQSVRLFLAFSPERKAETYQNIAGERMAELRIMYMRNNQEAIDSTLSDFTRNVNFAANSLSDAKSKGSDTQALAKNLNNFIKEKRVILSEVGNDSNGDMKYKMLAAKVSLFQSKVKVEQSLPEDLAKQEGREDLMNILDDRLVEASDTVAILQKSLAALKVEVSQATAEEYNNIELNAGKTGMTKEEISKQRQTLDQNLKEKQIKIDDNKKAVEQMKSIIDEVEKVQVSFSSIETKSVAGAKEVPQTIVPTITVSQ